MPNTRTSTIDSGIDERLLAGRLREEKVKENQRDSFQQSREENKKNILLNTAESFEIVGRKQSRIEAVKQAMILGANLRREIADGKFSAFIVVLILAIFKDLTDVPSCAISLCTAGTVSNFFISITLFFVFFLQKSFFKRWLIKKYLGRIIIIIIAEFIPGLNIFPTYVVATILLKRKSDKRIEEKEQELKELEKETEKIKKEIS